MDLGLPPGEIAILAGVLMAGGLVAGILSGLFGIGGGGIMVPILYELFGALGTPEDVRMHVAVGTTFAIIVPTSARAAWAHYKRGAIDHAVLRGLGPAAIIGVVLGSITAKYADDTVMKLIWVFSASVMSASLIFRKDHWRLPGDIGNPVISIPVGSGVGFIATMMGIGGGAQITSILILFGRSIHRAVGTAAGFSCIVAVPALAGYVWAGWALPDLPPGSLGYVSLIGAAAMIPASVLAAPLGVRLAHGLERRKLEIAFALFLGLVGLRFLLALIF